MMFHQRSISSCVDLDSIKHFPGTYHKVFCSQIKILVDTNMAGSALKRIPKRHFHWSLDHLEAVLGMDWWIFHVLPPISWNHYLVVGCVKFPYKYHIYCAPSCVSFPNFLIFIKSFCDTPPALFGQKTELIYLKRICIICQWSPGPPWKITIKYSRYTSM